MEENKKQMDAIDIEEAAKSRRQFEDKYTALKKKESDMQSRVGHIKVQRESLTDSSRCRTCSKP